MSVASPDWFRNDDAKFSSDILPVLASILGDLCVCNDKRPVKFISKFHAASLPPISLVDYLQRISKYSECSNTCFVLALIYIDRIQSHPDFIVNSLNIHRLLITSIMVAAKFFDDHYFNNAFYARIGGVSPKELNSLELEFLFIAGFNLTVTPDDYKQYEREISSHLSSRKSFVLSEPLPLLPISDSNANVYQTDSTCYNDIADPSNFDNVYDNSDLYNGYDESLEMDVDVDADDEDINSPAKPQNHSFTCITSCSPEVTERTAHSHSSSWLMIK